VLGLSYVNCRSQERIGCVLSVEECQKIVILNNQKETLSDVLKIREVIIDSLESVVVGLDSNVSSYVKIDRRQSETIEVLDVELDRLNKDNHKLNQGIRFRNMVIVVGLPLAFVLGIIVN